MNDAGDRRPPVAMFHVKHRFVLARRRSHPRQHRIDGPHMSISADVPPFPPARRILAVATTYGAVAGAVAGLALTLMNGAQHLIWHGAHSPLRSAATILLGGVIIVLLRRKDHHLDALDSLIAEAEDPVAVHWRRTLHLCALGVVAVGFGGAVGPEAGLIAVVTELSTILARRITSMQEQHDVATLVGAVIACLLPEREQH